MCKQKAEPETGLWDSAFIEMGVILEVLGHNVQVNCRTENTLIITFYTSKHQ